MWNANGWLEIGTQSDEDLKTKWNTILRDSEFTILKYVDHQFDPFGFTGLWLLGESHFAIHTFPEENKYYWELSSCVESKYDNYMNLMENIHGI